MPTIFNSKDSVFFVGGRGTKVGDALAGGCTLEAWWNPAKLNKNLANVMGTNGEPLSNASAWNGSRTACEFTESGGGKVVINKTGAFVDVQVGQVVNVAFVWTNTYNNGRYEVESSLDDGRFEIDQEFLGDRTLNFIDGSHTEEPSPGETVSGFSSYASATLGAIQTQGSWPGGTAEGQLTLKNQSGIFTVGETLNFSGGASAKNDSANSEPILCDCKVGGAFDTLQNASDNTDAAAHNVNILTNKAESAGAAIDVDTGGGAGAAWKEVVGVDDEGAELAEGSYVEYTGGAFHVFFIDDIDNVRFKHIYSKDADASYTGFYVRSVPGYRSGFVFEYCKSTGCKYAFYFTSTYLRDVCIKGGYYEADQYVINCVNTYGLHVVNAELVNASGTYSIIYTSSRGLTLIEGCLLRKTGGYAYGVYTNYANTMLVIRNCVFYDMNQPIKLDDAGCRLVQHNNIFILHVKATDKIINRAAGGINYSDYSCAWAMDGAPIAAGRWGGTGLPPNSIEADPQFVDAPNGDFRLKPDSPLLNKGMRTLNDGYSSIGAWQRISYLLGMK